MSVLQGSTYVAEAVADSDLTAATVTCTITAPDLTVVPNQATSLDPLDSKVAQLPIQATQVGTYLLVWTFTGAVSGVVQDQFTVTAPQFDLVSLPDLKEELNLRPTDVSKDAKLRRWVKAANGVVENVVGPVRAHAAVDWFDGGTPYVVLSDRWVSKITAVTEYRSGVTPLVLTEQPLGAAVDSFGYTWDRETNVVSRRTQFGGTSYFASGTANVRVDYVAGLTTIPEDIQLATVELIRHWYQKNEVAYRTSGSGPFGQTQGDDMGMMVGNYMVPNAVMELLTPWRRLPGMA